MDDAPEPRDAPSGDVTRLLDSLGRDDGSAAAHLLPLVETELRSLAEHMFRRQPASHTLQPTALVHEAFIRLAGAAAAPGEGPAADGPWRDREHFLAVAATAMRQILVDHARRKRAGKRGGDWERVSLAGVAAGDGGAALDAADLDEALRDLAEERPRAAEVVHLRFFGGMTEPAVARMLGVSRKTVSADWTLARAWLARRLGGGQGASESEV